MTSRHLTHQGQTYTRLLAVTGTVLRDFAPFTEGQMVTLTAHGNGNWLIADSQGNLIAVPKDAIRYHF